jgi:hypothetical protein
MSVNVGCVGRERSQSKCVPVDVVSVLEHGADEISAANVVQQVAEVFVAEWIIAEVLNDASAIRIGVGFF